MLLGALCKVAPPKTAPRNKKGSGHGVSQYICVFDHRLNMIDASHNYENVSPLLAVPSSTKLGHCGQITLER